MELKLKSLEIVNFKGIRSKTILFNTEGETVIFGDNETFKTTVYDAYLWLMIDKDSTFKSKFSIKPLDKNNQVIKGLETVVTGVLLVDGVETEFKKKQNQIWTKKRKTKQEVLTGNETKCFIDEVPKLVSEYNKEIDEMIGGEIFRILTDTNYFSGVMAWENCRKELIKLAGDVDNDDILAKDKNLEPVISQMTAKKDVNDIQTKIASQITELNKQIDKIPTRIDEANKAILELDFAEIRKDIAAKKGAKEKLESDVAALDIADPRLTDRNEKIKELNGKIAEIELEKETEKTAAVKKLRDQKSLHETKSDELQSKINTYGRNIKSKTAELNQVNADLADNEKELETLENSKFEFDQSELQEKAAKKLNLEAEQKKLEGEIEELLSKWYEIDEQLFTLTEDFICPTCKRELEKEDIEKQTKELEEAFYLAKTESLEDIDSSGKLKQERVAEIKEDLKTINDYISNAEQTQKDKFNLDRANSIEEREALIKPLKEERDRLIGEIDELEKKKADSETLKKIEDSSVQDLQSNIISYVIDYGDEHKKLSDEVQQLLEAKIETVDTTEQKDELNAKIEALTTEITDLESKLHHEDTNKKQTLRIEELEAEEKKLAQKIADLEKEDSLCDDYITTKVGLMDEKLAEYFNIVKFKMFEQLINGGVKETCIVMRKDKGVPYADDNHAANVNCGLDIINTFSKFYGIKVPHFIDNAESITKYEPSDNIQRIKLIVSEDDKELRIR